MIVYAGDLREGMKLKQAVYYGNNLLIDKESVLSVQIIKKIIDFGINYLEVYDEPGKKDEEMQKIIEQENVLKEAFKANYSDAVETAKHIMGNIKNGKLDKQKIDNIVSETIGNLEIDKNILVSLLEGKNGANYLFSHSINTVTISLIIGMALGYDSGRLQLLGKAAFLHDVGMSHISEKILNKEGELSEEEIKEIKKHTIYGTELAGNMEKEVIDAIKYHHERIDGSGYPEGISGKNIPEMARIIAIADVYAALTEERSYRNKYSYHEAMKIVMKSSSELLDSSIMKKFLKYMPIYPINSIVYLSDGTSGTVVKANSNPFRPVIDIVQDNKIKRVDLKESENLTKYIVRVKNS